MKNNMKKRVLAGTMALAVGAGMTGVYGAVGNGSYEVKAADEKDKEVETLKEAAENTLDGEKNPAAENDEKLFKDESVYVKADPSGTVKETTVTEWLKNPGNGDVKDESALSDVKNVKGEETFSKDTGNALQWQAKGEDIYYQGTSDGKLPVDVKVSYKLNGKSIKAEELSGKSGKIEITVDYSNHSRETVKVGKKDVKMYTPFAMVTAMMLSADEYSNIQVDNGKVISDGDKNIVVGLGLPGLSENLKLEDTDLDIDIPESIKITADVKNATVGPTVTMASTELMNELNTDDIDSFDELEDSLDELKDASQKLKDGSKDAADGAKKLADGSKELKNGTKDLKNGTKDLKGGTKDLKDGTKNLKGGTKELKDGTDNLKNGTKELKDGTGTLADGSKQVADGLGALNAKSGDLIKGVNTLAEGVSNYTCHVGEIAAGTSQVKDGTNDVAEGLEEVNQRLAAATGAVTKVDDQADKTSQKLNEAEKALDKVDADVEYTGETKAKVVSTKSASEIAGDVDSVSISVDLSGIPEEYRGEVKAAIEKAEDEANSKLKAQAEKVAKKALDSTKAEITEERKAKATVNTSQAEKALSSAQDKVASMQDENSNTEAVLANLKPMLEQLQAGAEKVNAGAIVVDKGAQALNKSSGKLLEGTTGLKKGGEQLAGGVKQLDKGASAVAAGAGKLKAGAGELDDGAGKLKAGAGELDNGAGKLDAGVGELDNGARKLDDGAGKLDNGTGTLADGADALADGTVELSDGMSEFKKDGIDKLTETFEGDFRDMKDRLEAMSDLGKSYKSYAGIRKGMDGSTKFIIETEGIETE